MAHNAIARSSLTQRVATLESTSDMNADAQRLWRELATLGEDFSYCAQSYGRVIISEVRVLWLRRTGSQRAYGCTTCHTYTSHTRTSHITHTHLTRT